MTKLNNRRNFIKGSVALGVALAAPTFSKAEDLHDQNTQEYYEWRAYKTTTATNKAIVSDYLESALVPALGRMGIDRIGVFTNKNDLTDHSIYMLIPYRNLDLFAGVNPALPEDLFRFECFDGINAHGAIRGDRDRGRQRDGGDGYHQNYRFMVKMRSLQRIGPAKHLRRVDTHLSIVRSDGIFATRTIGHDRSEFFAQALGDLRLLLYAIISLGDVFLQIVEFKDSRLSA